MHRTRDRSRFGKLPSSKEWLLYVIVVKSELWYAKLFVKMVFFSSVEEVTIASASLKLVQNIAQIYVVLLLLRRCLEGSD